MKENKIQKAFSEIHAPESVLREVNMRISETETKRTHTKPRRFGKLIPIAAILAGVLALSAAAYGIVHTDFYNNAFGTGAGGSAGGPTDYYDADGKYVKTVDEPAIERVEVDPELAERLVGDAVTTLNKTVSVNGYSATVLDYVFDENGIGTYTVVLENADGYPIYNKDRMAAEDWRLCAQALTKTADGIVLDAIPSEVPEESTPTKVKVVVPVVPYTDHDGGRDVTFVLAAPTPLCKGLAPEQLQNTDFGYANEELWEKLEITLEIENTVRSTAFVCDARTIAVSPLGMWIRHGANDKNVNFLGTCVIKYGDGSEYIVTDDTHNNYDNGLNDCRGNCWIHFNRLVDNEAIESVWIVDYEGNEYTFTRK